MLEGDAQQLAELAEHRRQMQARMPEAEPIVVTTPGGEYFVKRPLPQRAFFSASLLGMMAGQVFETVIETRFANGTARWRVVGANDCGVLVAERIADETEARDG